MCTSQLVRGGAAMGRGSLSMVPTNRVYPYGDPHSANLNRRVTRLCMSHRFSIPERQALVAQWRASGPAMHQLAKQRVGL